MSMRLDYFVNLKRQTSTIMLPLGIKYSMCDLMYDVNYCVDRVLCDIRHIMQMM